MAGRRLLDLAALFNASKEVGQKYAILKRRQFDVYSQTSSLARAVRQQTHRVTETTKASSVLGSRLTETSPPWSADPANEHSTLQTSAQSTPARKVAEAPIHEAVSQAPKSSLSPSVEDQKLRIQTESISTQPLPDGTLQTPELHPFPQGANQIKKDIKEEQPCLELAGGQGNAGRSQNSGINDIDCRVVDPQRDVQIPAATNDGLFDRDHLQHGRNSDSFYYRSSHTTSAVDAEKRTTIPERPCDVQATNLHSSTSSINSNLSSTASPERSPDERSHSRQVIEKEEVPGDVDLNLFHSPRAAQMLGGKLQRRNANLEVSGVGRENTAKHARDPVRQSKHLQHLAHPLQQQQEQHKSSNKVSGTQRGPNLTESAAVGSDAIENSQPTIKELETTSKQAKTLYELRESKVPSSRIGRLWNYGGLAAGMLGGAVSESLRRIGGGGDGSGGSIMLSTANMDRVVTRLSRMRGAALKLGQMLSFQDSKMLPAPIQEVLQRVQDRADYMPQYQRDKVLTSNLGQNWRGLFSAFDETPMAAASIGQVHSAVLKSTGARVAVKVQYPGVANSIDSDLSNLAILLTASRILPKGLYLDKTIANARTELAWECDYIREADCVRRFQKLLEDDTDVFDVPKVFEEASGKEVLTMEFMNGTGVTRMQNFTQQQKDWIGTHILRLCLREIVEFKFMQTDPNWTNFLYNDKTEKLELLDFGASREYPDKFITTYARLLAAASRSNREIVRDLSIELGYLTGHESKAMLDAHIASVLTLAEPFSDSSPDVYDFKDQTITERVKAQIPVMIRERLAPPPEETYSLHRKLSGAFLLCARLGSRVRCRDLFAASIKKAGIL